MHLRLRIGFLLVIVAFTTKAQQDSTLLESVTVYGLPEESYLKGSSVHTLDSSLITQQGSSHLGDVLAMQLPIYFRNYGNGMISGISLRGTSPHHTAVLWNGININSFSLGQADFSILPSTAFEEVRVHTGGGGARFGSGAFGGTVLLKSSTSLPPQPLSITQDIGSFGKYFTSVKSSWSAGRWSISSKIYRLQAANDFRVLATNERQQHAAFLQQGILQNISYRWSSAKSLSIHYWFHDADREVQPPIGQHNNEDEQQDRNHRLSIQYNSRNQYGLFSASGGYINDVIVFNGSRSTVTRWIGSVKNERSLAKTLTLQLGAEWNHIKGKIQEYKNGKAEEDRFDFTASFQKNIKDRLSVALNLRQPVVTGFAAPFLPYLGADYFIVKSAKQDLSIRGNISKNYRVPTLNERYWQNAGSTALLPETSYAAELAWHWRIVRLKIDNAWFTQRVDQWIQWVPQEDGQYIPRNVKQVRAQGFEVRLSSEERISGVIITPVIGYQFIKSITTEAPLAEQFTIGKQLIYTPHHTAMSYVKVSWADYFFTVGAQFSGKRYIDSSNSEIYALPVYTLFNFSGGRSWIINRHQIDFNFSVNNIFHVDYQQYSGRAMPGRNYNLKLIYQLNKSNE